MGRVYGGTASKAEQPDLLVMQNLLDRFLSTLMDSKDPAAQDTLKNVINKMVGNQSTRQLYSQLMNQYDPLAGLDKTSYMPMKKRTKKTRDKDTGQIETVDETPQEMLSRTNKYITLQNIIGDIFTGLGGTLNIKNQAKAQALQNMANTRSNRERELYGANAADYAAAVGAPAASGLGQFEQLLTGLVANRIYGDAALRRQAEMQAVLDAYNRNVGGSGLFFDARRKTGEQIPGALPSIFNNK